LNQNFTSLLRELKNGKSSGIFNNTQMKISDIADYLGVRVGGIHFTKTFKKAHGMPPTKYRKMNLSGRGGR
jgi:YesN/AraC family two-component response regulator